MYPYRFDEGNEEPAAKRPITQKLVMPDAPVPQPAPAPRPATRRRVTTTALVALALVGSTLGGGVVGSVAATQWMTPQAQPQAAQVISPQPVSVQGATSGATVAATVFDQVNQGVVEITVTGQMADGGFSGGNGSGFVVDASGLILTNYHVVANAREISVSFTNGAEREAQVLGTDQGNDLALLKVDLPDGVPVLPLADSDQVQVGETAIAIGSPFGLEQTVTQGIISAVHRDWWPGNGRVQRNLLQTDTPINPGNSGGPLLNANGEVIGINSMIESPVRGSVGVGFAIPSNTAKQLLPQLEAGAQLEPVWLGISGQDIDQAIAQDQGLSVQEGVLVTAVVPNGPAATAGLQGGEGLNERIPRGGDVVTAIDGTPVKDMSGLAGLLAGHKPGDVVKVTIIRDGQTQDVDVTLQAWPEDNGQ